VPENQVRRDHLLSHLINVLPDTKGVVFIGGTALNRTHLPDLRLSEDLDIHLLDGEPEEVVDSLIRGIRLEFPDLSRRELPRREDLHTFLLDTDRLTVQVQIVRRRGSWAALPTEEAPVRLYYSDLPETALVAVPSADAFAAMKLTAFVEREAPRDLFDLRGLAERGMLTTQSLKLSRHLLGRSFTRHEFERVPDEEAWATELSHQVADPGEPEEALEVVRRVLAKLYG
jgi:predicted nucleotidyltransferase component of viral defense system